MLDESSPLPLYRQLAALLDQQIRAGEYESGERIPSEPVLSQRYRIGRPTVRQATDVLVRKGLLERRRGSGTYVRPALPRVDLFSRAGTLRGFRNSGLAVASRWLGPAVSAQVPVSPEPAAQSPLPNPLEGQRALQLSRLSDLEGEPVLLERFWLDPALFAPLRGRDLAGLSLSEWVEGRLGLTPGPTEQVFDVVAIPAAEAAHLAAADSEPMLRVRRQVSFRASAGALYAELYCRTDRLAFCQTILGAEPPEVVNLAP